MELACIGQVMGTMLLEVVVVVVVVQMRSHKSKETEGLYHPLTRLLEKVAIKIV